MFTDMINHVDAVIKLFVIDLFGDIAVEIESTLELMMILSIILYGLAVMQGWIQTSLREMVKHLTMVTIIFVLATDVGFFTKHTYEIFTNAPNDIVSSVLLSTSSGSTGNVQGDITDIFNAGYASSNHLMFETGIGSLGLKLMGLLLLIITLAVVTYAAFLIILSKIALAVLLGLTPIFTAFLMFKTTRGIFEGWLRQVINYAIIPLLTYTVLFFCVSIIDTAMKNMSHAQSSNDLTVVQVFPFLFTSLVSVLLLMQVMGMASGIAGGISLSSMGAGRHSVNAGRKGLQAAKSGLNKLRNLRSGGTISN